MRRALGAAQLDGFVAAQPLGLDTVGPLTGTKTIVVVSHRASIVASCDRLYRLDDGLVTEEVATGSSRAEWV